MSDKRLKDPLYGYIYIENDIMHNIIDTPEFQRLRHIRQTSYAPLYSAALHNRFTHSIGVYHLGKIVLSTVKESIKSEKGLKQLLTDCLCKDFLRACLLHDIGHSPFSHCGEYFYYQKKGATTEPIYERLKELVSNDEFSQTMDNSHQKGNPGKPHEIMSAIIGIKCYEKFITDKSFFARCITGYLYEHPNSKENKIKNIFISLLNSSLIDVDKLDYLLRDSFVSGYDNVIIDYIRLLHSVEIKKYKNEVTFVFHKGALSVIENVIYAHDSERKWIQNHPTVLYEFFIIQNAIKFVEQFYKEKGITLFSEEALSSKGISSDKDTVALLCDDDIIFTLKNHIREPLADEYFNRCKRRRPVWKSEAEYRIVFEENKGSEWLEAFEVRLEAVEKFITEECNTPIINEAAVSDCDREIASINENKELSKNDNTDTLKKYEEIKETLESFKKASEDLDIEFDFVLIKANRFESGFIKEELKKQLIDFPGLSKPKELSKAITLLHSESLERKNFFYLYYKRTDHTAIDLKNFAKVIQSAIPDIEL